ncbi:MAG: hypothetical protein C5B57_06275 [Blastocatellia bacterium]|nr:MAG: hypothetical protein C5B57_06275 [Blastocatellia bacterium]
MTSRRDVLRIAVAGAVLLPLASAKESAPARRDSLDTPANLDDAYKVIFDERFPASVAFALDVKRRGIPIHGIRGDITALWYHDLYFHWRNDPTPIAGITTTESLFCLELLARDAGLRVTSRRALDERLVTWSIGRRA